jgi:hypothetical protein
MGWGLQSVNPGMGFSRMCGGCLVAVMVLGGTGCARLRVSEFGRVSKPNVIFGESAVFNDRSSLRAQTEPGATASGGAQAAGCTSCK